MRVGAVAWASAASVSAASCSVTGVSLSAVFADNMVLQREPLQARVWGQSGCGAGAKVVLRVDGSEVGTGVVTSLGEWEAELSALAARKESTLAAEDCHGTETLSGVAFGEVLLCSGQSNMEWSVGASDTVAEAKAGASGYDIRLCSVARAKSNAKQADVSFRTSAGAWTLSEAADFPAGKWSYPSAVCYYTAQRVFDHFGGEVVVGAIGASFGGAPIEAFSSPEALADTTCGGSGASFRHTGWREGAWSQVWFGMIEPIVRLTAASTLWYQGESNWEFPDVYACTFPSMIADWRKKGGHHDMPFVFVQLPGTSNFNFADLRLAQRSALVLDRVVMATAADLGDGGLHPSNKEEIARRVFLALLWAAYGVGAPSLQAPGGPFAVQAQMGPGNDSVLVSFNALDYGDFFLDGTHMCTTCCDGSQAPFLLILASGTTVALEGFVSEGSSNIRLTVPSPALLASDAPASVLYAYHARPQCMAYTEMAGLTGVIAIAPFAVLVVPGIAASVAPTVSPSLAPFAGVSRSPTVSPTPTASPTRAPTPSNPPNPFAFAPVTATATAVASSGMYATVVAGVGALVVLVCAGLVVLRRLRSRREGGRYSPIGAEEIGEGSQTSIQ